jgi:hypothetical protein
MQRRTRQFANLTARHACRADDASLVKIPKQSYRAGPSQHKVQARRLGRLKSFPSAAITIRGVELMHRIRKGQFDLRDLATRRQIPSESGRLCLLHELLDMQPAVVSLIQNLDHSRWLNRSVHWRIVS